MRVYVQAKHYAAANVVGRPAIQEFVGALAGNAANQGVFTTTSRFSTEAQRYAEQVPTRVVLVDSERLTRSMIHYGVGVQVKRTVKIVEIDEDFFEQDHPDAELYPHRYAGDYTESMDIRAERIAAGMTQSALALAAGVPQPNLSAYENGRRSPSPEVLERIARALRNRPSVRVGRHREDILSLLAQYHASHPRLIGSVARGEDRPDSDVDLLVDFSDDASLLDEVGLRRSLTDLLKVNVDVVASDTLRSNQRDRMLKDAVPL